MFSHLIFARQRAIRPSLTLKLAVDAYWSEHVAGSFHTVTANAGASSVEINEVAFQKSTSHNESSQAGGRHAVVGWHVRLSDWSAWCRARSNALRQQVLCCVSHALCILVFAFGHLATFPLLTIGMHGLIWSVAHADHVSGPRVFRRLLHSAHHRTVCPVAGPRL